MTQWILGLNFSHNGSACLIKDGKVAVAIQEERLCGVKRAKLLPNEYGLCIRYCLESQGIGPGDLTAIAWSYPGVQKDSLLNFQDNPLLKETSQDLQVFKVSHHLCHAFYAFCLSPYNEAAVLVVDGLGSPCSELSSEEIPLIKENADQLWESISLYDISKEISPLHKFLCQGEESFRFKSKDNVMRSFHSLGHMYGAVAELIFNDTQSAGKVMGLAPYGDVTIENEEFVKITNGELVFNQQLISKLKHLDSHWPAHQKDFENLAASCQNAFEKTMIELVNKLRLLSTNQNLCLSGGCALNSVANQKIIETNLFKDVFIPPACDDGGIAMGAAFYGLKKLYTKLDKTNLNSDSWGIEYEFSPEKTFHSISKVESSNIYEVTSKLLADGNIVGWFQGGGEFGPRALGHRSILLDPRIVDGKNILNLKVKFREQFRPFAPAILKEEVQNWFNLSKQNFSSPFMLKVCTFKRNKCDQVPSVIHVDKTGRVQTVSENDNRPFYNLLRNFYKQTNIPLLLNTSFNISGEPLVETPEDAIWDMLGSGINYCVVNNDIYQKSEDFNFFKHVQVEICIELKDVIKDGHLNLITIKTKWGEKVINLTKHEMNFLFLLESSKLVGSIYLESKLKAYTKNKGDFLKMILRLRRKNILNLFNHFIPS